MSALSDLVKYAQMGEIVYMRDGQAKYYHRAKEAAEEMIHLQEQADISRLVVMLLRRDIKIKSTANGGWMIGEWFESSFISGLRFAAQRLKDEEQDSIAESLDEQ